MRVNYAVTDLGAPKIYGVMGIREIVGKGTGRVTLFVSDDVTFLTTMAPPSISPPPH